MNFRWKLEEKGRGRKDGEHALQKMKDQEREAEKLESIYSQREVEKSKSMLDRR